MITAKEILAAVMEQIFNCVPGVEIYKGRLEEGFSVPAFLLNLTFAGGAKANLFHRKKKHRNTDYLFWNRGWIWERGL